MIIARNIGRLGNNMFQIATAIGYAKKYGYQWAADINSGLSEPYSCIHQVFNLPKEHWGSGNRYFEHPNQFCAQHQTHKDICHYDYHDIPDLGPNVSLQGFFQSWRYFDNAKEEVKKVFNLPHWTEYEDYVSIHVRRGDYVQHAESFPPVTMEYISKSIIEIRHRLNYPKTLKFIFFSDDIQWCKDTFKESTSFIYEYSEGRSERQDLEIMASCKHHIIANSSFSWWGAYLGHNPDRIVIAPSCERGQWYGMKSGVKKDCIDLLPPEWIQIKFR